MCGIAGYSLKSPTDRTDLLDGFLKALAHRGPDGAKQWHSASVGLAHRRLSIIDVEGGDHPIFSPEGRAIVLNGEIYNYIELRKEFDHYPFKTKGDTESILPLYESEGIPGFKKLRGMYAFAIADGNRLILARDPFGIKPLYYHTSSEGFFFASEPQAFLKCGLVRRGYHKDKMQELLHLRFTTGQETIFPGIYRLLPGEILTIENGEIIKRSFDDPWPLPSQKSDPKDLEDILWDSLQIHLRSDVPYGLFLSGGIDSSLLLTLMRKRIKGPLLTFTTAFPGSSAHDEREAASRVAQAMGTLHKEIIFTEEDFWALLPQVAQSVDDPTLDYATLPTFKMAQEAAKDVKVILCGEGADELFAGYRRYNKAMRWFSPRLFRERTLFSKNPCLKDSRLSNPFSALLPDLEGLTPLQKAQRIDCAYWLPNDLLTKLDRTLMAHGLEGRTPFLDRRVADFALSLPDREKIKGGIHHRGMRKYILRQWLSENFPEAAAFAKKKGFTVPAEEWVLKKQETIYPYLKKHPMIQDLCHMDHVESLFQKGDKGSGFMVWSLLFASLWFDHHVEGLDPTERVRF